MLAVVLFACLVLGPRAKWVKRILPNTANRIVFVVIVIALAITWMVQGFGTVSHGDKGEGYFTLTFATLCGLSLFRFIYDWWLSAPTSGAPDSCPQTDDRSHDA